MRIIALDDEKGALRLLMQAIRAEAPGSMLSGFDDANDALEKAKIIIPDIAFLDIRMSDISGLDMAPLLKEINPDINIIYVTGYSEYAASAFAFRASGYITKPVSRAEVRRELDNLRNPVRGNKRKVKFITFGGFDVYVDDTLLSFSYRKTKELLAFIFHKQGAMSTVKEIEAALWESEGHESYLRRLKQDMVSSVKKAGCDDLIICKRGEIGIDLTDVESDYQDYLDGKLNEKEGFSGNYLIQYSWAEPRNAALKEAARKRTDIF